MKHPFSFFAQFFGVKVKLSDKRLRKSTACERNWLMYNRPPLRLE